MNLLLVDDEKLALDALVNQVLKVLPNGTIYAFNKATKAVGFAKTNKIDIAFLDIDMPIMNGLEMAEALLDSNPKTNIIFVTAYSQYALDAFQLYASAYLTKPVTVDALQKAIKQLRYPVEEKRVCFHCFGNFEAYCDNTPISFSLTKTKQLLAYLVDRDGAICEKKEIIATIFEDEYNVEYYKKLRQDLIHTFTELGIEDVLHISRGGLAINKDKVICDYYNYLESDSKVPPTEYMVQYSFAESTLGRLLDSHI